ALVWCAKIRPWLTMPSSNIARSKRGTLGSPVSESARQTPLIPFDAFEHAVEVWIIAWEIPFFLRQIQRFVHGLAGFAQIHGKFVPVFFLLLVATDPRFKPGRQHRAVVVGSLHGLQEFLFAQAKMVHEKPVHA